MSLILKIIYPPHKKMITVIEANGGGVRTKPLLGSANTVQCQVRGCGGKAPARVSEHCSVSG